MLQGEEERRQILLPRRFAQILTIKSREAPKLCSEAEIPKVEFSTRLGLLKL